MRYTSNPLQSAILFKSGHMFMGYEKLQNIIVASYFIGVFGVYAHRPVKY